MFRALRRIQLTIDGFEPGDDFGDGTIAVVGDLQVIDVPGNGHLLAMGVLVAHTRAVRVDDESLPMQVLPQLAIEWEGRLEAVVERLARLTWMGFPSGVAATYFR